MQKGPSLQKQSLKHNCKLLDIFYFDFNFQKCVYNLVIANSKKKKKKTPSFLKALLTDSTLTVTQGKHYYYSYLKGDIEAQRG